MSAPEPRRGMGGAAVLLTATVVGGIGGYLVTWSAYRQIGPAEYAYFAVFWSALYLVVGALAGVQQEIARATHPVPFGEEAGPRTARRFGLALAVVVAVLVPISALLWGPAVFPVDTWSFVPPLALGVASYTVVAVLSGSLYGVQRWNNLAFMIIGDAVVRLVGVVVGGLLGADATVLTWLVAIPFPLMVAVTWPLVRGALAGRTRLDVGMGALTLNVARTLVASAATALMVSGFPLLIAAAADDAHAALLGEVIFTTTLVRAPLIVGIMSLQSYLVIRFRGTSHAHRSMALFAAAILGAGAVLAIPAALLGRPVLGFISGSPATLEPWFYAVLVISSALVGALTATGAALLAEARHVAYSAGWAAAAVATVLAVVLADGFIAAVAIASIAGPVVGLVVHAVCVLIPARPVRA